ncbi:hypothetical protein GGH95_003770 [Coemansia sp. RSA 1836]|nr:hypothetical protein GGH95_003770 [Coemansia sp. RSA 1836]
MDIGGQQRTAPSTNSSASTEASPSEPVDDNGVYTTDENTSELYAALARAVAEALAPLALDTKKRQVEMNHVRGHLCSSCSSIVSEAEFAFHASRCNGGRSTRLF